jgi:HPt (histidine-containing phosphotransfer) domain-containing protein
MNMPANAELPDFDPLVIEALPMIADGSAPDLAARLFDLFTANTRTLLDDAAAAHIAGDRVVYTRTVHTLKSTAGRMGAMTLSAEAMRQESLLRGGAEPGEDWPDRLRDCAGRALAAIALYRQDRARAG